MIYGFACLVLGFIPKDQNELERLPLIYFLVLFPVLVLFVFFFLVVRHYKKLFGPSDFINEDNYLLMLEDIKTNQLVLHNSIDPPSKYTDLMPLVNDLAKKKETRAIVQLGRSYLKTGRPEVALKFYTYALEKIECNDPLLYKIYSNIAYCYIDLLEYEKAIIKLKKAISVMNVECETWQSIPLAYSYYKLNDIEEENKWLERARDHRHYKESIKEYKNRYSADKDFINKL